MEIKERPGISDFFQVTKNIYSKNSFYVSIFKSDLKRFLSQENPLFSKYGIGTYFVVYKGKRPVGRISAHIHEKSNTKFNEKVGYFGYFETQNDIAIAELLLEHAQNWLRDQGMETIKGNFNLTAMQQIGVMTSGFDKHCYTDQVYGAPHIPEFLERLGYSKYFPMTTFEMDLEGVDTSSLLTPKAKSILENQDYEFLTIKKKYFAKQMKMAKDILNDGFQNNPMFVPLTDEEFEFQAQDMMWIVDEKISSLVTYKGRPTSVLICIPDLNDFLKSTNSEFGFGTVFQFLKYKLQRDKATVVFSSVAKDFQGIGVNPAMLYKVMGGLKERGYKRLGITWIGNENKASLRQMEKIGAKPLHGLHLFEKKL